MTHSTEIRTIGQFFRLIRRERGLTQAELANRSELSRTYIVALEGGKVVHPQRSTRVKLHYSLGTSDDELVDLGLLAIDVNGEEYVPERICEVLTGAPVGTVFRATSAEMPNADAERASLSALLAGFLMTPERSEALRTMLKAFAAEDHAPDDWWIDDRDLPR